MKDNKQQAIGGATDERKLPPMFARKAPAAGHLLDFAFQDAVFGEMEP